MAIKLNVFIILSFLFFLIYFIGIWSLFIILPVIIFVILPAIFKTLSFNIFLPRLIITISYVWITFVFTAESTNFLSNFEENVYAIAFLTGLLGSVFLLFYNTRQNAPSLKQSHIFIYRVMPILAYSVFIAVFTGLVFEFSGKDKYSYTNETYFFKNTIQTLNNRLTDLEELDKIKTLIKNDWYALPNISSEVGPQKKASFYQYSEAYNAHLGYIKTNMAYFNSLIDSFNNKGVTNNKIVQINTLCFDTIPIVNSRSNSLLQNQVELFQKNNYKFINELRKQDSILCNLTNQYNSTLDSLNLNYEKSLAILHRVSGYDLLTSKYYTCYECFYEMNKNSLKTKYNIDSTYYLTDYPINIPKWIKNSDNEPFSLNLKRFLIQVIIAVAVGVIGQSILGERTGSESI